MGRDGGGSKRPTADGHWQGRITLNSGKRPWLRPFKRKMTSEQADEKIAEIAERARVENWTEIPGARETAVKESVSD